MMGDDEFSSAGNESNEGRSLIITVSDPKKESEGINSYISYKVNTQTNLPEFNYGQFSVIRRYSDFIWLSEQLARDVPGAIVPPLPEKAVVGRFSAEFIESRRRLLEKFLNRLGAHDELSASKYFRLFLQADDGGLASAKAERKAEQIAVKKVDFQGYQIGSEKGGLGTKSPADEKIDEVVAYVNNLEVQMGNVAKHTTGLMKRNRDLANGLFEFGLSFTLLGQMETDPLSTALTKLGHTADQLSLLYTEQVAKETAKFEEPMYDYIRVLGAVKAALNARAKHKHALALACVDLDNKKALAAKLAGQPGKEERAALAEHAVEKAHADVAHARDAFERVSARVIREMERFKREKANDIRRVVLDYTAMQIEHNKRLENHWQALLPELEAIPNAPPAGFADDYAYSRPPPPIPPPPPRGADDHLGGGGADTPDLVGV